MRLIIVTLILLNLSACSQKPNSLQTEFTEIINALKSNDQNEFNSHLINEETLKEFGDSLKLNQYLYRNEIYKRFGLFKMENKDAYFEKFTTDPLLTKQLQNIELKYVYLKNGYGIKKYISKKNEKIKIQDFSLDFSINKQCYSIIGTLIRTKNKNSYYLKPKIYSRGTCRELQNRITKSTKEEINKYGLETIEF